MSDLARWIDGLDTRAVVVCLDCCHAGKVLGQRGAGSAPAARDMELRPADLLGIAGQGRYLIASCDEGQKSYECADLGHGLFTFHLLRGIAGEADSDGDGRVGLAELFNYVSAAVSRDARERFGREQKPWTSAPWAEETYISWPSLRTAIPAADPVEQLARDQGTAAAVQEIERTMAQADEETLRRSLRFLARMKDPAGIPAIFRCLAHASAAVRGEARDALHAFGWEPAVRAVEALARRGDPEGVGAVLDGLNAFEAHPRVVDQLDRLVVLLKGELRNRAILLLERKRLGLGLEKVAELFREIRSPYRIEKALGQGLFTESYLARDEDTGLDVVVRVLRPEFAGHPHVRAGFLDLSHRSVHLVHANLALTREARAFPDRHIYFAVRDYVAGVTLQRVLEAGKRFEPGPAIQIVRNVAGALTPLQRKGDCHGGIKPSNIFLGEEGRVVLGDPCPSVQGVGVALDRLAYDYRYAAPELFLSGRAPGPRSDFYALGCVAYELLCGSPPFVSDSFHELAARHIHELIPPPSRRSSPLGAAGDAVLLKLLARAPGERYAALGEVLEALASLENSLSEAASGVGPMPAPPPRPLLRDASLLNYQAGQSVLNFEQTGGALSEAIGTGPGGPAAGEKPVLRIPGYRILEVLGRGGMGSVYKARDVQLDRVVALKVLRPGLEAAGETLARFRREALVVARLSHPNIVQIYGLIEHEGLIGLALEYVDGGDLAQRMRTGGGQGGAMPIRDAAALAATLARAMEFAHQRGVLHRDLKPSNILLTPEGQPKIADFGLAKLVGDSQEAADVTLWGTVLGTPAYMAPEQADSSHGKVGPASDVYALGNILYEMLTGRRPFSGGHNRDLLLQITSKEAPAPRRVRPEIPRELDLVCLKCLEKDPRRRYPTAAALAEDLERWLRAEPVSARPPGLWRRLARAFAFRKPATRAPGDRPPDP